jgi:hypothetical protein
MTQTSGCGAGSVIMREPDTATMPLLFSLGWWENQFN